MNNNFAFKTKIHKYLKNHKWLWNENKEYSNLKNAKHGIREKIQKIGSFMAGMILPSISVFIAWGLWASMFLYNSPTSHGWFIVPELGKLVGPGIKYLIPLLIAVNAGRIIYGVRGSALGAFLVLVIIIGTDEIWSKYSEIIQINGKNLVGRAPNQILGAMIIAPLGVWIFKNIEKFYVHKIKPGFEMLIKNFGLALFAVGLGLVLFYTWPWFMYGLTYILTFIINGFGQNKFVAPLMTLFTEPTRNIFLNNALNHGVLSPIGLEQVAALQAEQAEAARSIFFLYGGNPGPGFGLLISYVIFKKGTERTNAIGASVVQLFGGIHEVYYVYVIQKPIMIISTIAGAMASMFIFSYLDGGTSVTVSPGSLLSVIATSPSTYSLAINMTGIFVGALVTFGVAALIFFLQKKNNKKTDLTTITFTDEGISFQNPNPIKLQGPSSPTTDVDWNKIKKLVVACDAGMGSSAMAASIIRKWVMTNNIDIDVSNSAIKDLTNDMDIIVTTNVFSKLVQNNQPKALVYSVKQFLSTKEYSNLYADLTKYKQKKV